MAWWRKRRTEKAGGWFAYAPNTGAWFTESGSPPPLHGDEVTSVKLMPEYSVEVPLWGCEWERLGLSSALLADLQRWQREFDGSYDPFEGGWTDAPVRDRWVIDAQELISRLRAELPEEVHLEVDLWPVEIQEDPGHR